MENKQSTLVGVDTVVTPDLLYYKYCKRCGMPIGIESYPFNYCLNYQDDIKRELDIAMEEHLKT